MRKQSMNLDRGTAAQRGYGDKWRRYRIGYLHSPPLRRSCERAGRLTSATIVDHIKDHRGDMRLKPPVGILFQLVAGSGGLPRRASAADCFAELEDYARRFVPVCDRG